MCLCSRICRSVSIWSILTRPGQKPDRLGRGWSSRTAWVFYLPNQFFCDFHMRTYHFSCKSVGLSIHTIPWQSVTLPRLTLGVLLTLKSINCHRPWSRMETFVRRPVMYKVVCVVGCCTNWSPGSDFAFFIQECDSSIWAAQRFLRGNTIIPDNPAAGWSIRTPLPEIFAGSVKHDKNQWPYVVGGPYSPPRSATSELIIFF